MILQETSPRYTLGSCMSMSTNVADRYLRRACRLYGPCHDSALRREPISMTAKTRKWKTLRASERATHPVKYRSQRSPRIGFMTVTTLRFHTEEENKSNACKLDTSTLRQKFTMQGYMPSEPYAASALAGCWFTRYPHSPLKKATSSRIGRGAD